MSYNNDVLCDYVTLWFKDAEDTQDDGGMKFRINPSSYYYQNRGQFCLVSVADGCMKLDKDDNVIILIDSALNAGTSNNGYIWCPLGVFTPTAYNIDGAISALASEARHSLNPNNVKYVISARPSEIRLRSVDSDRDDDVDLGNKGFVTLKFEYQDPDKTQIATGETFYRTF